VADKLAIVSWPNFKLGKTEGEEATLHSCMVREGECLEKTPRGKSLAINIETNSKEKTAPRNENDVLYIPETDAKRKSRPGTK